MRISDWSSDVCSSDLAALDDPGGPDGASLRLDDGSPLTLRSLKQRADTRSKLRGQPLVFINACESAELTPLFYSGFVPYFMNKGARGVIGTECRMPAQFAAQWARSEEHTSELQSIMRISYAVLCLKKKNNSHTI